MAPQVAPQAAPEAAPEAPVPAVQSTVEHTTPAPIPAEATTSAESTGQLSVIASSPSPSSSLTPDPPFSAAVNAPQPQASVADTSTTALSTALTTTEAASTTPSAAEASTTAVDTPAATTPPPQVVPAPAAQSEVSGPDEAIDASVTTAISATPSNSEGSGPTAVAPVGGAKSTGNAIVSSPGEDNGTSGGNGSTLALAGGIVGGVALLSLIAFLIWFWRRRVAKKKRDTLLTPLDPDPSFGRAIRNEKAPYGSTGPTPHSAKFQAAVGVQYDRLRGRFGNLARSTSLRSNSSSNGPSVNMNRGNSQFMDSAPMMIGHQRNGSTFQPTAQIDGEPTLKEKLTDMWTRMVGSGNQNLAGDDRNDIFAARGITGGTGQRTRPTSNKPDFLTLLNMGKNRNINILIVTKRKL